MNDSRSNPRVNVTWRGAVQISKDKIIAVKVVNFSGDGAQMLCSIMLEEKKTYSVMIEIPNQNPASKVQLVCKATAMYCILSGNEYRIGFKLSDIPSEHQKLIGSYIFVH